MISLRPHKLQRLVEISAGYQDKSRDWCKGVHGWAEATECRCEPNGKARSIALPDGVAYTYSYVVYMDRSAQEFCYGDKVRILDQNGNIITEKTVRGFRAGQLNSRIWL